ncbi:MAG: hypothetical protein AAB583_03480 [Patescibacteria group bacterium]
METDNTNQPVPPVQNTDSPQPPLSNPSSHSKVFIIALGVVLVLIIGIVSYILGTRKNQTVIQNQQQITTPPTIAQPSPIPHTNRESSGSAEIENWKTSRVSHMM